MCLLSKNIHDYYFVSQGKTSIPGLDDGEELAITDVSSAFGVQKKINKFIALFFFIYCQRFCFLSFFNLSLFFFCFSFLKMFLKFYFLKNNFYIANFNAKKEYKKQFLKKLPAKSMNCSNNFNNKCNNLIYVFTLFIFLTACFYF